MNQQLDTKNFEAPFCLTIKPSPSAVMLPPVGLTLVVVTGKVLELVLMLPPTTPKNNSPDGVLFATSSPGLLYPASTVSDIFIFNGLPICFLLIKSPF